VAETRHIMGDERFNRYLGAFDEDAPTSIRVNPRIMGDGCLVMGDGEKQVPWCPEGYYLQDRPQFTFDPLLHAGCYYVQEASSMFVTHILRSINQHLSPATYHLALDLCAAPGGKSTALRQVLPDDCVLISNEPMGNRAQILLENVTKWNGPNHIVTNNYPRDFRRAKLKFDLILCDVPCSGEGMFRKDPATISEWSPQHVEQCWQLQREIVTDAWECLNPGGIMIYSTCTFNTKENEENIRWILDTYDAEVLKIDTKPEWNITGSLLEGFNAPVYRFIPGITRGEGMFMCVIRKGSLSPNPSPKREGRFKSSGLRMMTSDVSLQPSAIKVELDYKSAIAYLRREALVLPADTPRGIVDVTFMGQVLGQVKNIGSRANNLYPKEWKIKTTYITDNYEAILRHT
jgi:16S rRNA C967 or C1407 C5-methylase (RsmB/RsmF family)